MGGATAANRWDRQPIGCQRSFITSLSPTRGTRFTLESARSSAWPTHLFPHLGGRGHRGGRSLRISAPLRGPTGKHGGRTEQNNPNTRGRCGSQLQRGRGGWWWRLIWLQTVCYHGNADLWKPSCMKLLSSDWSVVFRPKLVLISWYLLLASCPSRRGRCRNRNWNKV